MISPIFTNLLGYCIKIFKRPSRFKLQYRIWRMGGLYDALDIAIAFYFMVTPKMVVSLQAKDNSFSHRGRSEKGMENTSCRNYIYRNHPPLDVR